MIPEGRAPRPRPPPPSFTGGDLSVTGKGDLPLATQRRVESILTPPGENRHFLPPPLPNFAPPSSPFNSILERSHSIAIFAFFFRYFSSTRPNEFFQIQAYLIHWFRLLACYFRYLRGPGGGRTHVIISVVNIENSEHNARSIFLDMLIEIGQRRATRQRPLIFSFSYDPKTDVVNQIGPECFGCFDIDCSLL